jgi:Rrf2 family protein
MYNILNISEKTNLAIHALSNLARAGKGVSLSVSELANGFPVSESHLAKVMQSLVKVGIVSSSRGARGGFRFARSPKKITLLEVLEALESPINRDTCLFGRSYCDEGTCLLSGLVGEINERVRSYLARNTVHDFAFRDVR